MEEKVEGRKKGRRKKWRGKEEVEENVRGGREAGGGNSVDGR